MNAEGLARATVRAIDPTRQGIAAPPTEPDPLPGAAPISVTEACGAVEGWLESGMPLFGLHQIAVALAGEVARLGEIEMVAGETYDWLAHNSMQYTAHGRRLGEVLGVNADARPAQENEDGA